MKENSAQGGRFKDAAGPAECVLDCCLFDFWGIATNGSVFTGHFPPFVRSFSGREKDRLEKQEIPPNPVRIQVRLNKHPFFLVGAGIESMRKNTFQHRSLHGGEDKSVHVGLSRTFWAKKHLFYGSETANSTGMSSFR